MSVIVLLEYEEVRVIKKLSRAGRWFNVTPGVWRPPRSGDAAIIAHVHWSDDPDAVITAEKLDTDGYTIRLADLGRRRA